ncbi:MAG: hypothetical protein ABIH28_03195 [archaeon]
MEKPKEKVKESKKIAPYILLIFFLFVIFYFFNPFQNSFLKTNFPDFANSETNLSQENSSNYFKNDPFYGDYCIVGGFPGQEDSLVIKMIEPGKFASGEGTDKEEHNFRNGKTIPLCCYELKNSDGKILKICDYFDKEEESIFYEVLYEYQRDFVKVKETIPKEGVLCYYYFYENGEVSGMYCQDSTEFEKQMEERISLSKCNQIENLYQRESCYSQIATKSKDKVICYSLQNSSLRNACLNEISCQTGDILICERFEKELGLASQETNLCYNCIAKVNNNKTVCLKITNDSLKSDCLNYFK